MVRFIAVDDSGRLGEGAVEAITSSGIASSEDMSRAESQISALSGPTISRRRVSIIGDSFSSTGYGTNWGHIWHTVALSHADGILVGNYAANGHTALDALEGRTSDWGADPDNSQISRAEKDVSQSVVICLGYNDQNNGVSQGSYIDTMRTLIRRVKGAGKRAIVVQPPIPIRARAGAIPELKDYLSGLSDLSAEEDAFYVPTWDLLGDYRGLPNEWGQGDGSHVNAGGHDAFGRVVAPRLLEAIGGLGEFASATRTPSPLTDPVEVMTDASSTSNVKAVPEYSRDLFPSGEAYSMELGISNDSYVSLGVPYRGTDLGGKTLRLTFSYEIVSLPAAKVSNTTTNAGLFVQAGTFNPWEFRTIWGGLKLEGSRGVASVVSTVPAGITEWVFALTLLGITRTEGDPPVQVRVGSARVEEVMN